MKNKAPLLAVAVAAIAACLFLLNQTNSGPKRVGPSAVESGGAEGATPTEADDLVEVASRGTRDQGEVAPDPSPDVAPTTAHTGSQDRGAEADKPKATIVGRVTDGLGRPLVGAEVLLSGSHRELFPGVSSDPSGGVADTLVHTGADGRFEMAARMGQVRVSVGFDGFAPLERDLRIADTERMDLGDLRIGEGVRLAGRVLDAGGKGVANASLLRKPKSESGFQVFGGQPEPTVTTTDSSGRFQILRQAAGPYEFDVVHSDHPPQAFSGRVDHAGENRDGLIITLREGEAIEGRVVDLPSTGVDDLHVIARHDAGADSIGSLMHHRPGGPVTADVDDAGRFVIRGLEPGAPVLLSLIDGPRSFGSRNRRSAAVPARSGDRDARLGYSLGATLRFRVVDGDGNPLESLEVNVGFDFARPRIRPETVTENGVCVLERLWPREGGQSLELKIKARGFETYRDKEVLILPGEDRDLGAITLSPRPQVILTVRSAETGAPVEGAVVRMRTYVDPAAGGGGRHRFSLDVGADDLDGSPGPMMGREARGTTDEEGRCTLDSTPGRTVEFVLYHPDFAEATEGPLAISTSSSSTEYEVTLDPGGSVRVTVADAAGIATEGATIERRFAQRRMPVQGYAPLADVTDASGVATVVGLPAGEQLFRLKPAQLGGGGGVVMMVEGLGDEDEDEDGGDWTSVVVLPGETTELSLRSPTRGSVRGIVNEVGAPLAGASITLRRPEKSPLAGLLGFGSRGPKTISDARGEFRFDDIEEGDYELVVSHSTRAMEEVWPFEAEGTRTKVEVDLDVTIIEGGVFDESGQPVVGALVRPEKAAGGGTTQVAVMMVLADGDGGDSGPVISIGGTSANEARTDEDGLYSLRGVTAGLRIQITANAEGYDEAHSEPFEVDAGATRDGVDIQFTKPGKIVVTVENAPFGAFVLLRRRGEFQEEPRIEALSGSTVTIDAVAPGDWTVEVRGGPNDLRTDPNEIDVTVVAGETATAEFVVR